MTDASTLASRGSNAAANARAMVYVRDRQSEDVIRESLTSLGVDDAVFKSAGVEAAITEMSNQGALQLLIVDAGAGNPLDSIPALLAACSPSTGVIVLGESNDLSLYRHLRDAGVADYIFKPLVSTLVTKACSRILNGDHAREGSPNGELIFVMGVRGGCGATTVAVRTAWRLAQSPPRPVLLLDLHLRTGDAALQLDVAPNEGLQAALESVERVDSLFLERGVIHITKQLDLLASLDPLEEPLKFDEDAVLALLEHVRRRYRYVVVDVPTSHAPLLLRVLRLPSTLLLVSDGRLASARDVGRWRERIGLGSAEHAILHVLNRSGAPGALGLEDFARASGRAPDVIIPESREIAVATNQGIRAKPDCPELARGLAPVFQRIAGASVVPHQSLLARLLG